MSDMEGNPIEYSASEKSLIHDLAAMRDLAIKLEGEKFVAERERDEAIVKLKGALVGWEVEIQNCDSWKSHFLTTRDAANAYIGKLEAKLTRAVAGLNDIASWNEGEHVTGYFDEPRSARIARETLAEIEGKQNE